MRRAWALVFLLLLSMQAYGQTKKKPAPVGSPLANTAMHYFPGVPTGTCDTTDLATNGATGDLYDCKGGAWNITSLTLPTTLTAASVFTNTQMNTNFSALINECSPLIQFQNDQGAEFDSEGITSCITAPSSGTVHQVSAGAFYAVAGSSTTNVENPVGVYAQCNLSGNGQYCWPTNPIMSDMGFNGAYMQNEFDWNVSNASTQGAWLTLSGVWTNTGSTNTGGILITPVSSASSGTNKPFFGFECATGCVRSGGYAIYLPESFSGNGQYSNAVVFAERNPSGVESIDMLRLTFDSGGNPVMSINNSLGAKSFTSTGTQTISGCALTLASGGAAAGKFTSGTTGTCTVTITPGITAPNGFYCSAMDLTTPADSPVKQSSTTTTTCTLSSTTASGDVITWEAIAF